MAKMNLVLVFSTLSVFAVVEAESVVSECSKECALCVDGRCRECRYGWYGHNCKRRCHNCWITGCKKHSGICDQCKPGTFGQYCRRSCPDNCRRDRNNEVYCRREDGKCLDGCKEGWWGVTCNHKCSEHCEGGTCLQINGNCINDCETGWYGVHCNRECPDGCRHRKCYCFTGKCVEGCKHPSLYGSFCSQQCGENCNGSDCNMNGDCTKGCIDGFRGRACSEVCPNNCLTCEQYSDRCTKCKADWTGSHCEKMTARKPIPPYRREADSEAQQGLGENGSSKSSGISSQKTLVVLVVFLLFSKLSWDTIDASC